ncbi:hypothetical protein PYCCODRAFT_1471865 [Trametes coccinea BRFM310]|uniref:Uncharacterized protein n=1 Tax=Trametes coccinea (strain BRFM310) TaxID=1353009 RepID=A0A1Y2I8N0_TRAC3|nr:hypothetical protein PYCCODRAFT_1471865 [Trametes coccinea BRFM310]
MAPHLNIDPHDKENDPHPDVTSGSRSNNPVTPPCNLTILPDHGATLPEHITTTSSDLVDYLGDRDTKSDGLATDLDDFAPHHEDVFSGNRSLHAVAFAPTTTSSQASQASGGYDSDSSSAGVPSPTKIRVGSAMKDLSDYKLAPQPRTSVIEAEEDLECSSETGAGFIRIASEVRRQQVRLEKTITSLEQQIDDVRKHVADSLQKSADLLSRTQKSIVNERKAMEKQHEIAADKITALENRLLQAQRHIATLQAQHLADSGIIERMASEISVLWLHQEAIGGRLEHAEECEQHVQFVANRLKDYMDDITVRELGLSQGESAARLTLAEELIAHDAEVLGTSETAPVADIGDSHEWSSLRLLSARLARKIETLQGHLRPASLTAPARASSGSRFALDRDGLIDRLGKTVLTRRVLCLLIVLIVLAAFVLAILSHLHAQRLRHDAPVWMALGA